MSEGDVSLIRDEDVLRRMWQQTEDFSRKKEIRAHMYRLREERLRNLYSPEPPAGEAKGCEFTSTQGHVKSFANQTFQSMKSKEVRDASSPPKEFTYRGQDLKELSNAGWNVESENRTTDDGHTHVKTVQANIEGKYDVDGGRGQFAAIDQHKQAVTEFHDDNSSLKRKESSSNTAAHEQVLHKTDDGTQFSSSTTSSSSTSKFQQVSSTKHESVPYVTNDDYDQRQASYDTNRNEELISKREVANDFQQNLRRNNFESGELVSRKVDYPDSDTKVIVETRCLPDGTRVTSTRREFRGPAVQTSHSEHHSQETRSENNSYSTTSQQKSDVRKSTSKVTRHNVDSDFVDIVDSQKTSDNYDFKRDQQTRYLTTEKNTNDTQHKINKQRYESDVNEINKRKVITSDTRNLQQVDVEKYEQARNTVSKVHHMTKDKVDEYDQIKNNVEQVHRTTKDQVEEVVERKTSTERYQTTYQTDYSQKKISNDWSPTHQAWASTLRADTPTSTRAPSPGGRTYQSSTSSLRSSVSPDKTCRKPPSRGGSPSKVDRYSPTRTVSDKYSSTQSTHSVTESRTHRYTSAEARPPHGKSPTRPSSSPDRKHPDGTRPRQSMSPTSHRPSASPERKSPSKSSPTNYHSTSPTRHARLSPEKQPVHDDALTNNYPTYTSPKRPRNREGTSPMRQNQSPTRQPGERPTTRPSGTSPIRVSPGKETVQSTSKDSSTPSEKSRPTPNYPRDTSPSKPYTTDDTHKRSSPSPERKPGQNTSPRLSSASPDRKPGYMKPTAITKNVPKDSPVGPNRKSPVKETLPTKITKATEDHYTFIDEETKMYTRTNRNDQHVTEEPYRPCDKSPSPSRKSPPDDSQPEMRSTLRKTSRSPSPPKGPVTFTENRFEKMKKPETIEDVTETSSPTKDMPPSKDNDPAMEPSPSKYRTYDKKQRRSQEVDEVTKITTDTTRYDSLTRREKSSSPRKTPDASSSPTKKAPRDSVSPTKSVSKDTKFKHRNDFINMEINTEEINKKTVTKERPRQLVTPSTSPTRKPKQADTAPSTGQSSPTTSVSGFVYFSSPRPKQTIVTDLDDQETYVVTSETDGVTTYQSRPETLDFNRPSSPSKIPCRSPSPEKRVSPSDSLPRKSSLKKPTNYTNQVSPTEKPPSSFRVSPTVETQDQPEHKVVKKDHPGKPPSEPLTTKSKPPLERRETYEERCRKILGMMTDDTNKNTTKKTLLLKEPASNISSPNMSPYLSPSPKIDTPFKYPSEADTKVTDVTETDFITCEREQIINERREAKRPTSRDTSPTTLQDIISKVSDVTTTDYSKPTSETSFDKQHQNISMVEDETTSKKPIRSSVSPEKKVQKDSSPERKTKRNESPQKPRGVSPTKPLAQTRVSPERKQKLHDIETTKKPTDKVPREPSPSKRLTSPEKQPGYLKPTSATFVKQETYDIEESKTSKTSTLHANDITKNTEDVKSRRSPVRDVKSSVKDVPFNTVTSPTDHKTTHIIKQETYDVDESDLLKNSMGTQVYLTKATSPTRKSKEPTDEVPKSSHLLKQETYDVEESEVSKVSKTTRDFPKKPSGPKSTPTKQEPEHSRTPSPTKTKSKITVDTEEFVISEREQEILDKVQKSLRKLSPDRSEKSPTRGKSPAKSTPSLQDIEINTNESTDCIEHTTRYDEVATIKDEEICQRKPKDDKPKDSKAPAKPSSRNLSPIKKIIAVPTAPKGDKDKPLPKSRSISPKKPVSPTERPQSPQVPKASGIKPREPVYSPGSCKQTNGVMSPTKSDKTIISIESKKANGITTQNSYTKTSTTKTTSKLQSPTNKHGESEPKRAPTPKNNNALRRDTDTKVTRTASDMSLKTKKPSPQRMKSKPEIHVNVATKTSKQSPTSRLQKPTISVPHSKLPSKPKSATALNTPSDEDDIIIDVQQAKSSRENSPDRICPTPINFGDDDVGTPRFPDEVNEPDDDFRQRPHHTIHEAESIVDDIVEICEDDELFIKVTGSRLTDSDECLLSVNDKVSKFTNKIDSVNKTRDATKHFQDTERKVHSDYIDENLKSDECLLSVSEKVNKFAKGSRDTKDSKSPSRRIVDEYDKNTTYQDDYTKLSVNDKAHLFVETAENAKSPKTKPAQKVERPILNDVDESLKSDDCLLSVSDKVNKFVKTAEQFLTESQEVDEKEKKIKEQHDLIMRKIVQHVDDDTEVSDKVTTEETIATIDIDTVRDTERIKKVLNNRDHKRGSFTKETASSHAKVKDYQSPNVKPTDKTPTIKITTLRSSEAVKKAKALFENIATTQKPKDTTTSTSKTTKLTDIGVIRKSPKTDSTIVLHPSIEDGFDGFDDFDSKVDAPLTPGRRTPTRRSQHGRPLEDKPRSSPTQLSTPSHDVPRTKSPMRQSVETTATIKTVTTRHPAQRAESPNPRPDTEKLSQDKVPGYQRPTKTSLIKEETIITEETEVSSRRGSGKFGVELRRTSAERVTTSCERRRSIEHHQPCIEDIFDLDLLEQMLEKVVGYEQRRRIRAQIRVARKMAETDQTHNNTNYLTTPTRLNASRMSQSRSPDRHHLGRSPDRQSKTIPQRTISPDRRPKPTPQKTTSPDRAAKTAPLKPDRSQPKDAPVLLNGHAKAPTKPETDVTRQRPRSPEKPTPKIATKTRSPVRQPSPEKKTWTTSPTKTATLKPKSNRFNEYATAYMKKAGMSESDKLKLAESKTKKIDTIDRKVTKRAEEIKVTETKQASSITKSHTEQSSSKDIIEVVHLNGKRSPSPEKKRSPERQVSNDRLREKSPSPVLKRQKSDMVGKKETIIKTVYEVDKKVQPKVVQEEKPSWVTNRNLKKITSETRTFSSKKIESEKPKYRAPSPSKVISKPIDVITSSYGPGPLDSDGKPLFGIKALRNGASNFQVKGTVIRQEFHSRNGGEPEGSVSVTAYSNSPEELERLLQVQGERPSRLHGLAAITTTKKFGGDTGNSYKDVHTREERAALDQFTHSDRRVTSSRVEDVSDVREDRVQCGDRMIEDRATDRQNRMSAGRHVADGRQERLTCDRLKTEGRQERITTDRHQTENRQERITSDKYVPEKQERVAEIRQERVEKKEEKPRGQRTEERRERTERTERREDRKTVRQSSVKSLTEKYIKSASETKSERSTYPKAGLILRTATMKDSVSSDSSAHAGLARTDSEHSLASVEDTVVSSSSDRDGGRVTTTTTTRRGPAHHVTTTTERSFLDSSTKVTGVQDILTRMKNADIVIQEGDTTEDSEARALLNKFLGATVLMSGMQSYVTEKPGGKVTVKQETVRSSNSGGKVSSTRVEQVDLDQCWDERVLRKLLDECTDYEQRRRLRARIRTLMAEQEACASAVTEALAAAGEPGDGTETGDAREEEEVTTVTSSVRRDSSEKIVSSSTTTKTSKVIESMTRPAPKPVSPFAKFRQLEKQNSVNSPNSPKTPQSPGSPAQPFFKFTDPALQASALTIKERLLQWCRDKTRDYENVKLENFSTSWADGLAFCALLHHFLPNAFDYSQLTPDRRRHNFTLAFKVADEKAGIYPLLDVDDMVAMRKPDWKCVFTYVQSIHRRFKDQN